MAEPTWIDPEPIPTSTDPENPDVWGATRNQHIAELAARTVWLRDQASSGPGMAGSASDDASERLAAWLDSGSGALRIASAGDSTMNDGRDWLRAWFGRLLGPAYPSVRLEASTWATDAYPAPTVLQPGEPVGGDDGGLRTVVHDTFTRTADDLHGTTPDIGGVWSGPSGAVGQWRIDGSAAVSTPSFDGGPRSDGGVRGAEKIEAYWTGVTLDLTPTTAVKVLRLTVMDPTTAGDMIRVELRVNADGTTLTRVVVAGSASQTINGPTGAIPSGSFDVEMTIEGSALSCTVNGQAFSGTLNAGGVEIASRASAIGFYGTINIGPGGASISEVQMDVTTAAEPGGVNTISLRNGGVAGSKIDYQHTRLADMYPADDPIDVMIIGHGHNYGTGDSAAYIAEVDDFLTDFLELHPEAMIVISSQNPQHEPRSSAQVAAQADRMHAARLYARQHGYTYVPVYETFARLPDGGRSLLEVDGLHPTTAQSGTPDDIGSVVWAKTWHEIIRSRTLV